ncbi:hypothetical protein [Streptomyces sp. NPDC007988]|uniref:hypothetical protein n=1 Tax=Streptomyces sp. NPDC007988 TaxID=3364802 RepID=UPI0036E12DC4
MSWTPTRLQFTHDGTVVAHHHRPEAHQPGQGVPHPVHECLQFADGSLANAPLDSDSTVYVDYVRVWR